MKKTYLIGGFLLVQIMLADSNVFASAGWQCGNANGLFKCLERGGCGA